MLAILLFILLIFPSSSSAQQYEEGWRWRESFKDVGELLDGDVFHKSMSDYEHGLSLKLIEESNKNIALVSIGIVYEVRKPQQSLKNGYEGDFVRQVNDSGKIGIPCAFVSGYQTSYNGNSFHDKHDVQTSLGENFYIINGDYFRTEEWKTNIEIYFAKEKATTDKILGDDVTNYVKTQMFDEDNFAQYFSHSEQWILQYLSLFDRDHGFYIFNAQIRNILAKIYKKEGADKDMIEIKRVILHIHTNRDACIRCASTMSIFSRSLSELLHETTGRHAHNPPLILVSSRTNYQERRFLAGHDNHYHEPFNISSKQKHASSYYKAFVNLPTNFASNVLQ